MLGVCLCADVRVCVCARLFVCFCCGFFFLGGGCNMKGIALLYPSQAIPIQVPCSFPDRSQIRSCHGGRGCVCVCVCSPEGRRGQAKTSERRE